MADDVAIFRLWTICSLMTLRLCSGLVTVSEPGSKAYCCALADIVCAFCGPSDPRRPHGESRDPFHGPSFGKHPTLPAYQDLNMLGVPENSQHPFGG